MKQAKHKIDFDKIVRDCERIANELVNSWKPLDSSWKTVNGAAYLRLSDPEQVLVENGSLEQQIYMAVAEAQAKSKYNQKNYRITKFYIEPGISGRTVNRKKFSMLERDIERGEHSFVIVKELSRLMRDGLVWKMFFKRCQLKKCEIIIRGLPFDPNNPASILQMDMLAAIAEYEASNTAKRIKDSVHSAMINNGKFNSTHKILGFDTLIENGRKRPGYYQVNHEELQTVIWIMETFVKYGSHQVTIESCNKKGIKNWNGEPFGRHSMYKLLTNTRYIGKWSVNLENRDLDQSDLSEQERFKEVELPHGAAIPLDLWFRVQETVTKVTGNLGKNTRVTRVYPLSGGILKFHDGSTFRGCSGTGKTVRSHYYFNSKNNLRINTNVIERCVTETVTRLIQNSGELQNAIRKAGVETQDKTQFLQQRISEIKNSLQNNQEQKTSFLKNMSHLIHDNSTPQEVMSVRNEFKILFDRLAEERAKAEEQLADIQRELAGLSNTSFSWSDIARHAQRVQEVMSERDPVALKRAYFGLFKSIVIGAEDEKWGQTDDFYS